MKAYKVYYEKWDSPIFLCTLYTFHEAALLVKVLKQSGVESYIQEVM